MKSDCFLNTEKEMPIYYIPSFFYNDRKDLQKQEMRCKP